MGPDCRRECLDRRNHIRWKSLKSHLHVCGLYYKHVMIVNYASSGVNKLKASLNDDARVVIYNRHMFIIQATDFRGQFPIKLAHF